MNFPKLSQALHRPSSGVACLCKEYRFFLMSFIQFCVCIFCYVIKNFKKTNFQNSLKKTNNTPYTREQPLMMAYEGPKSARDNFGKFIHQFQPETETPIRKLEEILKKLYRQNLSLAFNETCLNERLLPNYMRTQNWEGLTGRLIPLLFLNRSHT